MGGETTRPGEVRSGGRREEIREHTLRRAAAASLAMSRLAGGCVSCLGCEETVCWRRGPRARGVPCLRVALWRVDVCAAASDCGGEASVARRGERRTRDVRYLCVHLGLPLCKAGARVLLRLACAPCAVRSCVPCMPCLAELLDARGPGRAARPAGGGLLLLRLRPSLPCEARKKRSTG